MSNPFRAFSDSYLNLGLAATEVMRVGGANSVWLILAGGQPKSVLKYFDVGPHALQHFLTEFHFLEINQDKSILPEILWSENNKKAMALRYYQADPSCSLMADEVLDIFVASLESAKIPAFMHEGKPGIVSWWDVNDSGHHAFSLAELVLLDSARSSVFIDEAITRLTVHWVESDIVHGDLKLANMILQADNFKVIDWESLGRGPKEWDHGGFLQSVIHEVISGGRFQQWAQNNFKQVVAMLKSGSQLLKDATTARLVQTAMERSQKSHYISLEAANLLQIAEFIAMDDFSSIAKAFE